VAAGGCSSRPCMVDVVSSIFLHLTPAALMEMPMASKCCPYLPHTIAWHMVPIGYVLAGPAMRWPVVHFMIERLSYGIHIIETEVMWIISSQARDREVWRKGYRCINIFLK
jgi:hypothetical protein